MGEEKVFCSFIDNHPWEVPERINGYEIVDSKFEEDKSKLTLTLGKGEEKKKLEITTNDKNSWLWLHLTEKVNKNGC